MLLFASNASAEDTYKDIEKELATWQDMLKTVRNRIAAKIRGKAPLEDIQTSRPTAGFDARYGGGFINSESFVKMLYENLTQGDG